MLTARMAHAFWAWRQYRETIRELDQLSDRQLEDIGLTRAMIRDVARRSAFGASPAPEADGRRRGPAPVAPAVRLASRSA